jgi:hypothetical protein
VLARIGKIVDLPESKQHALSINTDGETLLASSIRETGQDIGEIVQRENVEDMGDIVEMVVDGDERRITGGLEERIPSKRLIAKEADQPINLHSALGENGTVTQERSTQQEVQSIQSVTRPKKQVKKQKNHKNHKKRNVIDDLFGHLD